MKLNRADRLMIPAGVIAVFLQVPNVPGAVQQTGLQAGSAVSPTWWTYQHTITLVVCLGLLLAGMTLWAMRLRRKVRAQNAHLLQSEMKFRSLVEESLVGVYIIQDGRFAYANPRLAEIFGYTLEEMTCLGSVREVIHPDDRSLVENQIHRRVVGELTTAHYGFRGLRKDGSLIHVEVLGSRSEFEERPAVIGTLLDVTERKRAEEEIFNSRQMLRTILDTIPQRVFWKSTDLVYLGCNKPFAKDCGYSDPNELIGKTDYETASAEYAERFRADDREVIATGRPKLNYEEEQLKTSDGKSWLKTSKVPVFDQDGTVAGVLGTYEDISDHKRAAAELAEASSLLETMLTNSPDYIYFKDRDSRFVHASASLAHMFRVDSPDQLKGKTDFDFFLEEHARAAFEDEQRIISTGEPIIGKPEKETHTDGRTTWALTTKLPWHDRNGNIIGTFGISKDVTTIKETERKLKYERELFHTLVDNLPDAIYFKDINSRFVRLSRSKVERAREILLNKFHETNPEATELPAHLKDVERCSEYLIGKTDFDLAPEDRARSAYNQEMEIIQTGKPLIGQIEMTSRLEDGKAAWYHTTKMLWRDEAGNVIGTFGVTRDITDLKEAEAKLEAAHQRLVETSRIAGMAEVATDVLHNVGNVLNSVNVSCSIAIDRIKTSKMGGLSRVSSLVEQNQERLGEFFQSDPRGRQVPEYLAALANQLTEDQTLLVKELEQIVRHIDHIKQIVAMQQSYAKVAGVRENISVTQLVEDALSINAAALKRHDIRVRCHFDTVPDVVTEKHKVLQILVNLIRNAKYAMDEVQRPDKQLDLCVAECGNGMIKIEVIDNGVGIPEENLTRIFAHGFTTRRNGHGFGLHSSALAVRDLGGSLIAESGGTGKGATFRLILPYKVPSPRPQQIQEQPQFTV